MTYDLVWLKRDLRLHDHAPLKAAARGGALAALYIFEPEVICAPDFDASHFEAIIESLRELRQKLHARGGCLLVRVGEACAVLDDIYTEAPFRRMHSHEETGNGITYARDLRVKGWCASRGIGWHEYRQFGVVRRLADRDGWSRQWVALMREEMREVPSALHSPTHLQLGDFPDRSRFGLPPSERRLAQHTGESVGLSTLETFLTARGERYQSEMSSPNSAWESCSRLSVALAYGNVSMRRVYQETERRRAALKEAKKAGEKVGPHWLKSLNSFSKRLRWHCHFMQKLESQPSLEFQNMARAYDGLRENEFRADRFDAFCKGETGYPMVDACIRCLHETGWINFRMRAMLMSFASYHLWLHWRPTSVFLARHFLDYEAGIHYTQSQMQSGTTGINTFRIYSPIKQVKDQDPAGTFIRRWVPELQNIPDKYIAQPELTPPLMQIEAGCRVGEHYPLPIVDHKEAVSHAKSKLYAVKRRPDAREEAKQIYEKHGSRRRPSDARGPRRTSAPKAHTQGS